MVYCGSAVFRAVSLWLTESGGLVLRLRLGASLRHVRTWRHSLGKKAALTVSRRLTARNAAEPPISDLEILCEAVTRSGDQETR